MQTGQAVHTTRRAIRAGNIGPKRQRSPARGRPPVADMVGRRLERTATAADRAARRAALKGKPLTDAEKTVHDWLTRGRTLLQTADKMGVSINTVKTHQKQVYAKRNVVSQVQLICRAYGIR